jgi:hypothetical protein
LIRLGIIGGTILILWPNVDHPNKKVMFVTSFPGVDAEAQKCNNFVRSCGIAHTPGLITLDTPGLSTMFFFLPIRIEPHYNNWFVEKSTKVDWSTWIFFSVVQWWWLPNIVQHGAKKTEW